VHFTDVLEIEKNSEATLLSAEFHAFYRGGYLFFTFHEGKVEQRSNGLLIQRGEGKKSTRKITSQDNMGFLSHSILCSYLLGCIICTVCVWTGEGDEKT